MEKDEYSPYKIVHHQKKLQELKNKKQIVPLQVQIVPSNICNQRCSFCTYRMKDYMSNLLFDDKKTLSYEKIIECLDDFVEIGVRAVHYTGGGEPLVHPKIFEIFKETFKRNLDLALVSNGMALNPAGFASFVGEKVISGNGFVFMPTRYSFPYTSVSL